MSRSRLPFSPDEARQVLWVRALEEADATGGIFPAEARAAASRQANDPDDATFLRRRAALLTAQHSPDLQEPEVPADSWLTRLPRWTPWAVMAGAFVLGWLTNELGPTGRISLLSFPLLGLIVWNLTVCGLSLWADWKSRSKVPASTAPRRAPGASAAETARVEFTTRAAAWERPRQHARIKWTFHAAAIALALGIVAGMYARGLAKAYEASWESTFLERPQVRALTSAVLGPASLITGIAVPDPLEKNTPQSAAPWIHLWAASALLFIVIPRLLMANMARLQVKNSQPDYREEFDNWLAVCRSLTSGHTQKADIIPVHYEPGPRVRDGLRLILQHLWGAHVSADFHPPIAYGAEESATVPSPQYLALMFPLATTPESDIHGALIGAFAAAGTGRRHRLLVLDAAGFEDRFHTLPEYPQRLAARRASWEKIAGDAFPVLLLDEAARRDPSAAARSVFAS